MTSAQLVETSVTNNSSFQNYPHPDDHTIRTINEIRRRAGDVMSYTCFFVGREKRRCSLCNERPRLASISVTMKTFRSRRNLPPGVWPPWPACHVDEEEKKMLLGAVIVKNEKCWGCWKWLAWGIFGKAGLNVNTNGILWDSSLMEVSSAVLRGIWCTFSIASWGVFISSL